MPSVGTAHVTVKVNTKGFTDQLDKMLAGLSKKMEDQGEKAGKDFNKGLKKTNFDGAFAGLPKAAKKASKDTAKHLDGITAKMNEVAEESIDTSDIIRESFEGADDSLPELRTELGKVEKSFEDAGKAAKRGGGSMRGGMYGTQALVHAVIAMAPAIVPVASQIIPAISGIATGIGFAGLAAGAAIGSFQGVGDAMKAMSEADLEPTAENLEKMRVAMADLTPEGRDLVNLLHDDLLPMFGDLRDIGQQNLFPGVISGLESLMTRAPELQRIMAQLTGATGDVFADWGAGLASEEADEFFTYLETEAAPTLEKLGTIVGNVAAGLAEMLMAFDPLSDEFLDDLVNMTESFQEWAGNLSDSPEFREFIDYIIEMGPKVSSLFGQFVDTLVAVVEAIAPLGGPSLAVLEAILTVIEAIVSSPLGTPLLALLSFMSAVKLAGKGVTAFNTGLNTTRGYAAKAKGAVTGLSTGFSGLAGNMRSTSRLGGTIGFAGIGAGATRAAGPVKNLGNNFMQTGKAMGRVRFQVDPLTGKLQDTGKSAGRLSTGLRAVGRNALPIAALGAVASGTAGKFGLMNTATFAMMGAMAGPWGAAIGGGVGLLFDIKAAMDGAKVSSEGLQQAMSQGGEEAVAQFGAVHLEAAKVEGGLELVGTSSTDMAAKLAAGTDISAYTDKLRELAEETQTVGTTVSGETIKGPTYDAKSAEQALKALEDLEGGVNDVKSSEETATAASAAYSAEVRGVTTDAEAAAAANKLFNDSLIVINDALSRSGAIFTYRAAMDGAAESIRTAGANSNAAKAQVVGLAQQGLSTLEQLKGVKKIEFATELENDIRGLLRQFPALAPALRPFLNQLTKVSGKRFKTYIDAETETATDRVRLIGQNYRKLPKRVRTRVEASNAPLTMKQITNLQRRYKLTPKQVATLVSVKEEQAIQGTKNVQKELKNTGRLKTKPVIGMDTKLADIALRTTGEKLDAVGRKKAEPKITVNNTDAVNDINQVETGLNNLPSSKTVTITTNYVTTGKPPKGSATGGWIHGPGTGTSDSIPWMLSTGEFIIPARSAAKLGDSVLQHMRQHGTIPATKMNMGGTIPASQNGTLAVIAEAGRPERVTPLDNEGFTPAERRMLEALEAQLTGGNGSGDTYNVHPSQGMNEQALADLVARRVAWKRRRGAVRR